MARLAVNFTRNRSLESGSMLTRASADAGCTVVNPATPSAAGAVLDRAPAGCGGVVSDGAPLCAVPGRAPTLVNALHVWRVVSDGHRIAPSPERSSVTIATAHTTFATGSLTAHAPFATGSRATLRSGSFRMLDGTSG
jgi:hypothetical protein